MRMRDTAPTPSTGFLRALLATLVPQEFYSLHSNSDKQQKYKSLEAAVEIRERLKLLGAHDDEVGGPVRARARGCSRGSPHRGGGCARAQQE